MLRAYHANGRETFCGRLVEISLSVISFHQTNWQNYNIYSYITIVTRMEALG